MNKVLSPLTNNDKVKKIGELEIPMLVEKYKKEFSVETSHFFEGLDKVSIYECLETGYQFYYPFNLAGDGPFYEQLQKWEHYYEPWKWEHQLVLDGLKGDEKILEIGSGAGGFLGTLHNKKFDITGLELNEKTVRDGKAKGLKIHYQTIQDHAVENPGKYDLVCSFQVVEHIAEIKSFIQASLDCLKPGGKMIISVPNNDSYISTEFNLLNTPPHHMGLWREQSLRNLDNIFGTKVTDIHFSPLGKHIGFFRGTMVRSWKKKYKFIPYRLLILYFNLIKNSYSKKFQGLTIQAHYTKQ